MSVGHPPLTLKVNCTLHYYEQASNRQIQWGVFATKDLKMTNSEKSTSDLPKISAPALRALTAAGYLRLDQLTHVSEAELLRLHGMGPKAIGILRQALQEKGMAFASASHNES